jgi:Protein of unknown function (DUF3253)
MTPEEAILELIAAAKPGRTIHPTDAARHMYKGKEPDGWMKKMTSVRHAAIHLARLGQIALYRKGKVADPNTIKGVYRLGVPAPADAAVADDSA